jgi:hypothetical protein
LLSVQKMDSMLLVQNVGPSLIGQFPKCRSVHPSGRWMVGAVGIELWSIIPKPLCFQYCTETHRKANRGQIEAKDSFGGTARPCYLSYSFNFSVEFRRSSALWRKPLFTVVPRGKFDRTLFHLFCKSRSYECRQRRNTEAEMDPPRGALL